MGVIGQKPWYPQCPLFSIGEISFPRLEKYHIHYLIVVGNGGPLMLVCSNVHVSEGFSIFGNAFNTTFGFPTGL